MSDWLLLAFHQTPSNSRTGVQALTPCAVHAAPTGTWHPPVSHPEFEEQLLKSLQNDPRVLTVKCGGWRLCYFEFPFAFLITHQAPLAF